MLALLACHPALDRPADTCASCHAPESEAWRASLHATADRTPAFAEAFRRAQDPWCHTCHLPGTGVDCASCHGPSGRTCEQCHQFDLPGTSVASQDTAREHAASSFSSTPCTGCHDPHLAPGAHDAERVRAALDVLIPRGDLYERTSQAIEGEVRFEIVRDGRVVVQTWAGDGRPLDAPMRDVVEVARR